MRRTLRSCAAACALTLLAASPALAQDVNVPKVKATPTPTVASPAPSVDALQAWMDARAALKAATEERAAAIVAINKTYTESVKAAQVALRSARDAASTPAAKSAALSQYSAAVAAATEARQNTLNALPPLPADPGPRPKVNTKNGTKAPKATV